MLTDIQSNNNLSLVAQLLHLAEAPEYVRRATPAEAGVAMEKHANYFADPINRCLPVHTKVACYLSRAYFEVQRDSLPEGRAKSIEDKLAHMEQVHEIASDCNRLKEVVESQKQNSPEAIDTRMGRKLASGAIQASPDSLIVIARHLAETCPKLAEHPMSFTSRWAFDEQFHNLGSNLRALHYRYPQHKQAIFDLAAEVEAMSPRKQLEEFPEIAAKLAAFEPNLKVLHNHLSKLPVAPGKQIKLAGCIFPEEVVAESLCSLHKIASVPLVRLPLATPVPGWQDQLESLDRGQQQKLADYLLDNR